MFRKKKNARGRKEKDETGESSCREQRRQDMRRHIMRVMGRTCREQKAGCLRRIVLRKVKHIKWFRELLPPHHATGYLCLCLLAIILPCSIRCFPYCLPSFLVFLSSSPALSLSLSHLSDFRVASDENGVKQVALRIRPNDSCTEEGAIDRNFGSVHRNFGGQQAPANTTKVKG